MYRNPRPPRRAALVAVLLLPLFAAACSNSATSPTILPGAPYSQTDLVAGTGRSAQVGQTVGISYTVWLYDPSKPDNKGTQYQTNVGGTPLTFALGAGQVIAGMDRGVVGMQIGGSRRLVVPPDLAYGSSGSQDGTIPPYATLIFEVTLLTIQ